MNVAAADPVIIKHIHQMYQILSKDEALLLVKDLQAVLHKHSESNFGCLLQKIVSAEGTMTPNQESYYCDYILQRFFCVSKSQELPVYYDSVSSLKGLMLTMFNKELFLKSHAKFLKTLEEPGYFPKDLKDTYLTLLQFVIQEKLFPHIKGDLF